MPDAIVNQMEEPRATTAELLAALRQRDDSMSPVTELSSRLPLIRTTDPCRSTALMAILNATPDSFSDGGTFTAQDAAQQAARIKSMIAGGATIIDIGGQSTRPNAALISAEEELSRILPVIHTIRRMPEAANVAISIDTFHARVARDAIAAGADIINDVSGGLLDTDMLPTIAELRKTIVLTHMRGTPQTMNKLTQYPRGVVEGVATELASRVQAAREAGIYPWRIVLDPGIGFAKNQSQNLEMLRRLDEMRKYAPRVSAPAALNVGLKSSSRQPLWTGLPWLLGTSRKGFIGKITNAPDPSDRVMGTAATVAASVAGGADIVRVHDVPEMAQVVKMADAIYRRT
jgi:2-amino-4-hydroxy-6-hydroxymethyldihydropteridine diphosphokinase / dihydropteroate synthase